MKLAVAVDLQDEGANPAAVVAEAGTWAARSGATLDVLYVQLPALAGSWIQDPAVRALVDREIETERARADAALRELLGAVPEENRGAVRQIAGAPVDAIVAESEQYDGVVVVTHGRTGLDHLWSGSISEQVVRRARCVVIVLPLPQREPA